jgi:valyl-tRNA synthetase
VFGLRVPVLAHPLADPEKGSGIAMICTFGDTTDVTWWRELDLPTRNVLGRDGRLLPDPPPWGDAGPNAVANYAELAGKNSNQARTRIVELLRESGDLQGEPRPISHPVKFYERGDRPLEIVTSRQWYFRNGGRDADLRAQLLARGKELHWHPPYMQARYESWVEGLTGDWLVSRQRFFGVPIPLWYALDEQGEVDYSRRMVPTEDELPIDPSSQAPAGYDEAQRGQANGFVGDPDVMDTWATSSLTPEIAASWEDDPDLFARVFPMDLRPQSHEIIRTWLFSTVVRAHLEFNSLPFTNVAISGWILDPDRKKMSKSKGNVVTPLDLLEKHGSDGVRYWAANGRPGVDTAYDEGQMKVGRRLAIKILNASKFALGIMEETGAVTGANTPVTAPLDRSMLAVLADLVDDATNAFTDYDYARALERTERFFWGYCDDYVELVKQRAYSGAQNTGAQSAARALELALSTVLRLFAPHLPFVTEEVWSWWQEGSIHRAPWPTAAELRAAAGADATGEAYAVAADVLGAIRKAKSEQKRSMRTPVTRLVVNDTAERLAVFAAVESDVAGAGGANVGVVTTVDAAEFTIDITLAEPEPTPDP